MRKAQHQKPTNRKQQVVSLAMAAAMAVNTAAPVLAAAGDSGEPDGTAVSSIEPTGSTGTGAGGSDTGAGGDNGNNAENNGGNASTDSQTPTETAASTAEANAINTATQDKVDETVAENQNIDKDNEQKHEDNLDIIGQNDTDAQGNQQIVAGGQQGDEGTTSEPTTPPQFTQETQDAVNAPPSIDTDTQLVKPTAPEAPVLTDDMTAEERNALLAEYDRQVAEYDEAIKNYNDNLAGYEISVGEYNEKIEDNNTATGEEVTDVTGKNDTTHQRNEDIHHNEENDTGNIPSLGENQIVIDGNQYTETDSEGNTVTHDIVTTEIKLVDAEGNPLKDTNGKPITGTNSEPVTVDLNGFTVDLPAAPVLDLTGATTAAELNIRIEQYNAAVDAYNRLGTTVAAANVEEYNRQVEQYNAALGIYNANVQTHNNTTQDAIDDIIGSASSTAEPGNDNESVHNENTETIEDNQDVVDQNANTANPEAAGNTQGVKDAAEKLQDIIKGLQKPVLAYPENADAQDKEDALAEYNDAVEAYNAIVGAAGEGGSGYNKAVEEYIAAVNAYNERVGSYNTSTDTDVMLDMAGNKGTLAGNASKDATNDTTVSDTDVGSNKGVINENTGKITADSILTSTLPEAPSFDTILSAVLADKNMDADPIGAVGDTKWQALTAAQKQAYIAAYNEAVTAYNTALKNADSTEQEYNEYIEAYNNAVDSYNRLVDEYNATNSEGNVDTVVAGNGTSYTDQNTTLGDNQAAHNGNTSVIDANNTTIGENNKLTGVTDAEGNALSLSTIVEIQVNEENAPFDLAAFGLELPDISADLADPRASWTDATTPEQKLADIDAYNDAVDAYNEIAHRLQDEDMTVEEYNALVEQYKLAVAAYNSNVSKWNSAVDATVQETTGKHDVTTGNMSGNLGIIQGNTNKINTNTSELTGVKNTITNNGTIQGVNANSITVTVEGQNYTIDLTVDALTPKAPDASDLVDPTTTEGWAELSAEQKLALIGNYNTAVQAYNKIANADPDQTTVEQYNNWVKAYNAAIGQYNSAVRQQNGESDTGLTTGASNNTTTAGSNTTTAGSNAGKVDANAELLDATLTTEFTVTTTDGTTVTVNLKSFAGLDTSPIENMSQAEDALKNAINADTWDSMTDAQKQGVIDTYNQAVEKYNTIVNSSSNMTVAEYNRNVEAYRLAVAKYLEQIASHNTSLTTTGTFEEVAVDQTGADSTLETNANTVGTNASQALIEENITAIENANAEVNSAKEALEAAIDALDGSKLQASPDVNSPTAYDEVKSAWSDLQAKQSEYQKILDALKATDAAGNVTLQNAVTVGDETYTIESLNNALSEYRGALTDYQNAIDIYNAEAGTAEDQASIGQDASYNAKVNAYNAAMKAYVDACNEQITAANKLTLDGDTSTKGNNDIASDNKTEVSNNSSKISNLDHTTVTHNGVTYTILADGSIQITEQGRVSTIPAPSSTVTIDNSSINFEAPTVTVDGVNVDLIKPQLPDFAALAEEDIEEAVSEYNAAVTRYNEAVALYNKLAGEQTAQNDGTYNATVNAYKQALQDYALAVKGYNSSITRDVNVGTDIGNVQQQLNALVSNAGSITVAGGTATVEKQNDQVTEVMVGAMSVTVSGNTMTVVGEDGIRYTITQDDKGNYTVQQGDSEPVTLVKPDDSSANYNNAVEQYNSFASLYNNAMSAYNNVADAYSDAAIKYNKELSAENLNTLYEKLTDEQKSQVEKAKTEFEAAKDNLAQFSDLDLNKSDYSNAVAEYNRTLKAYQEALDPHKTVTIDAVTNVTDENNNSVTVEAANRAVSDFNGKYEVDAEGNVTAASGVEEYNNTQLALNTGSADNNANGFAQNETKWSKLSEHANFADQNVQGSTDYTYADVLNATGEFNTTLKDKIDQLTAINLSETETELEKLLAKVTVSAPAEEDKTAYLNKLSEYNGKVKQYNALVNEIDQLVEIYNNAVAGANNKLDDEGVFSEVNIELEQATAPKGNLFYMTEYYAKNNLGGFAENHTHYKHIDVNYATATGSNVDQNAGNAITGVYHQATGTVSVKNPNKDTYYQNSLQYRDANSGGWQIYGLREESTLAEFRNGWQIDNKTAYDSEDNANGNDNGYRPSDTDMGGFDVTTGEIKFYVELNNNTDQRYEVTLDKDSVFAEGTYFKTTKTSFLNYRYQVINEDGTAEWKALEYTLGDKVDVPEYIREYNNQEEELITYENEQEYIFDISGMSVFEISALHCGNFYWEMDENGAVDIIYGTNWHGDQKNKQNGHKQGWSPDGLDLIISVNSLSSYTEQMAQLQKWTKKEYKESAIASTIEYSTDADTAQNLLLNVNSSVSTDEAKKVVGAELSNIVQLGKLTGGAKTEGTINQVQAYGNTLENVAQLGAGVTTAGQEFSRSETLYKETPALQDVTELTPLTNITTQGYAVEITQTLDELKELSTVTNTPYADKLVTELKDKEGNTTEELSGITGLTPVTGQHVINKLSYKLQSLDPVEQLKAEDGSDYKYADPLSTDLGYLKQLDYLKDKDGKDFHFADPLTGTLNPIDPLTAGKFEDGKIYGRYLNTLTTGLLPLDPLNPIGDRFVNAPADDIPGDGDGTIIIPFTPGEQQLQQEIIQTVQPVVDGERDPAQPSADPTDAKGGPKTGDSTNVRGWLAGAAMAMFGLMGLGSFELVARKKRQNQ